jgi:hypothetical protein
VSQVEVGGSVTQVEVREPVTRRGVELKERKGGAGGQGTAGEVGAEEREEEAVVTSSMPTNSISTGGDRRRESWKDKHVGPGSEVRKGSLTSWSTGIEGGGGSLKRRCCRRRTLMYAPRTKAHGSISDKLGQSGAAYVPQVASVPANSIDRSQISRD